jgi:DNA-binding CsgD family transcriptional regulator
MFKVTNETQILLCQPLNAREIEVLQHLADGLGTADIAANRSTSAQVIKNYTYRACQKLGADNRAHLIAVAFPNGNHQVKFAPEVQRLTHCCGRTLLPDTKVH